MENTLHFHLEYYGRNFNNSIYVNEQSLNHFLTFENENNYIMAIKASDFIASLNGKSIQLLNISDGDQSQVFLCNYGARVVAWESVDGHGDKLDIVLGFDSIDKYLQAHEVYHGATIGRYANRIANGSFELNGESYTLKQNSGANSLHGGPSAFHNQVWEIEEKTSNKVVFSKYSPHMKEGFPGNLTVKVVYEFVQNELKIEYSAVSDQDTVLNLTHHSYFNLNGEGSGSVMDHEARFYAEYFTPINKDLIPTGKVDPVYDTEFNFLDWKYIGEEINNVSDQLKYGGGYDHNFVVKNYHPQDVKQIAAIRSMKSRVQLTCWSDKPGFQFYSANFLDGSDNGKSGNAYKRREAFAIEPQFFPDSPNQEGFPDCTLKAGETYTSRTIYKLKVLDK